MKSIALAALAAAPMLAACQPVVGHGPELEMSRGVLADVRVESVWSSSKWTLGERPFPDALRSEVVSAMRVCASNGSRPVQLRFHVDRLAYAGRSFPLGHSKTQTLDGRIEVVDLETRTVLARMPIVATAKPGWGAGTREPNEQAVSRQFASEICRKAFRGNSGYGVAASRSQGASFVQNMMSTPR